MLAFAWLEECAPEAKKILVLRDPRDVVSSMLEVGRRQRRRQGRAFGFVRDTLAAVDYMNQCLKAGTALAETSANCLVIYYEDMVSDPLAVGNRMYRFIGVHEMDRLDLENEQFEAARNRESWIDWATPGTISGGVEKDRVGVAEQRLKRGDLDYICAKTIHHPLLTTTLFHAIAGVDSRRPLVHCSLPGIANQGACVRVVDRSSPTLDGIDSCVGQHFRVRL